MKESRIILTTTTEETHLGGPSASDDWGASLCAPQAEPRERYPETGERRTIAGLKWYLDKACQTPLLSEAEEMSLARRRLGGDAEARNLMIEANLRLVVSIAKRYQGFGIPFLDLISEGNIGLSKAVDRFDPERGARLATYATPWIKQGIRHALATSADLIRLPTHRGAEVREFAQTVRTLTHRLDREPSVAELAEELGVSRPVIQRRIEASKVRMVTSLHAPVGHDASSGGAAEFHEVLADPKAEPAHEILQNSEQLSLVRAIVGCGKNAGALDRRLVEQAEKIRAKLTEREADILRKRYGFNGDDERALTLEQIGLEYKLTRERIRQLEEYALRKVRVGLQRVEGYGQPS